MVNKSVLESLLNNSEKILSAQLFVYFQKQMILEQFARSREMQKMKQDITNDVLNSVSINVENKVRQTLDDIFKEYNY